VLRLARIESVRPSSSLTAHAYIDEDRVKPPRANVSRRALLRGRLTDPSPRESGQGPALSGPSRRDERPGIGDLLVARREGMGSFFEVRLPASCPGGVELASRALDLIEALEDQLTVYRDDSEVSRLNATAHLGPVAVEAGLFAILERGASLARQTGGAYDIAAGALSAAWGFTRGPRRVPSADALADARARSGTHLLRLDPERRTVAFTRPGVIINLGSIGKGYALDRAAGVVRAYPWPTSTLIHGGASSVYALGSPPGTLGGRWEIAVRDPGDGTRSLGTFRLRDQGLGTSGAFFQEFEAGGRRYGHIIDPRTGEPPSNGPLAVTVVAPTAAEADALSTALYLLGPEGGRALLADRPNLGALFVLEGPRLVTANLPDFLFRPARGVPVMDALSVPVPSAVGGARP
jgi:thiamine biosynthesis lipoprotein